MPVKRLCCHPGCPFERLPGKSFCEHHKAEQDKLDEKMQKKKEDFFNNRGKSKYSELYNTSRWRLLRAEHLKNYPVCERCGSTENLQVHHDYPSDVDYSEPDMFYSPEHLVTLCVSCHARETNRRAQTRPTSLNCFCTGQYEEGWSK